MRHIILPKFSSFDYFLSNSFSNYGSLDSCLPRLLGKRHKKSLENTNFELYSKHAVVMTTDF